MEELLPDVLVLDVLTGVILRLLFLVCLFAFVGVLLGLRSGDTVFFEDFFFVGLTGVVTVLAGVDLPFLVDVFLLLVDVLVAVSVLVAVFEAGVLLGCGLVVATDGFDRLGGGGPSALAAGGGAAFFDANWVRSARISSRYNS